MNLLTKRRIILASASPRRLALLRQIGVRPTVISADIEESRLLSNGTDPANLVMENSVLKARTAYTRLAGEDVWIVAADTVVVCEGKLFGKPADAGEARDMLRQMQGRMHKVYTGQSLIDGLTGEISTASREAGVWFCPLGEEEIIAYVADGEPLDKAGAYGLQGAGGLFVHHIEGDYSAVVGLSLPLLREMILAAGKPFSREK